MSINILRHEDHGQMTMLVGTMVDQAALAGVLSTLYELHLTLLSVESIGND